MSQTLMRLDATYVYETPDDVEARITIFCATELYARERASHFRTYGWKLIETAVDVEGLTHHERGALVGPIWPLLPLDEILALIRQPPGVEAARAAEFRFEPTEEP